MLWSPHTLWLESWGSARKAGSRVKLREDPSNQVSSMVHKCHETSDSACEDI